MRHLKKIIKAIVPKKYMHFVKILYLKSTSFIYSGNKFFCPCCNRSFRKFLPIYVDRLEPRGRCPRCGSLQRHRLLWLYLKNRTNLLSDNLRVLHFAPEYAFLKLFRSLPNLDYVSADLRSPLAMVRMDISNIPYEDNTFDVILCSHVLQYVNDDREVMRELLRVLKPEGWAILTVPIDGMRDKTLECAEMILTDPEDRDFSHNDFARLYGADYKKRLEESGYKVIIDGYVRELGPDTINKYLLQEDENIYLCIKPHSQ